MDQTVSANPEETNRAQAALATSIQLYKAGNLYASRNALMSCLPAIPKTNSKLATEILQKLVAIDFDLADRNVLMSDIKSLSTYLSSVNQHDRAVTVLQTALAIDPEDSEVAYLLAKTVITGGDLPLGLPMLRRVLESETSNSEALELFIKSSLKYRPDQALPFIQKYLDKNVENPDAYVDAASIFEQLGLTTEAVNVRQKAVEKFKDPLLLKSFLESSSIKYPTEPFFQGKLLEIALAENDVNKIDSQLSQLSRIMKNKEDWRSALGFIELRLLIDPKNRGLVFEAAQIRKNLGYQKSPLDFDDSVDLELSSARRKLLFMDWPGYFAELAEKVQSAIDDNDIEKQLSLRMEWLKTEKLRQILADRLEGAHKMPDELWANLMSEGRNVEELKSLYKRFPNQLGVIKVLLEKFGDDRFSVNSVWLDISTNAARRGDWETVNVCISLLASTNETLAPHLGRLKPIVSETLR